jgi:uncharacterized membrane protein YeiH
MAELDTVIGILGTVAFAVTAVLAVIPKGIDVFGATVMALITAIGGGTISDVILGVPSSWSKDLTYVWVALASSVVAFYGNGWMKAEQIYRLMLYLDAAGVALFVIRGVQKAMALQFALPVGPVILGVIGGIGGGLIRDTLAGNTNLLMKHELYALPLTVGAVAYLVLAQAFPGHTSSISFATILLMFMARVVTIDHQLVVPRWMLLGEQGEPNSLTLVAPP